MSAKKIKLPTKKIFSFFSKKRNLAIMALLLLICLVFFKHLYTVLALQRTFTQTDWSGGADTGTTIDYNQSTGWTKFYSKTGGVNSSTAGEVKLNVTITQP